MSDDGLIFVLCTFPDEAVARAAAGLLVEERLVACVNILPGVQSVYRWEGAVESSVEALTILKTTAQGWAGLEERLREIHPYQVPEIVAVPAGAVSAAYLEWVQRSVACPAGREDR